MPGPAVVDVQGGGDFRRAGTVPHKTTLTFSQAGGGQILEVGSVVGSGNGVSLSAGGDIVLGASTGWGAQVQVPSGGLRLQSPHTFVSDVASVLAPAGTPLGLTGGEVVAVLSEGGMATVSGGNVDLNGSAVVGVAQGISWQDNIQVQASTSIRMEPGALATGDCVRWEGASFRWGVRCLRGTDPSAPPSDDPLLVVEQGGSALEFCAHRQGSEGPGAFMLLKTPSGNRYPVFSIEQPFFGTTTTRLYSSGQPILMLKPSGTTLLVDMDASHNRVLNVGSNSLSTSAISLGDAKDRFLFVRFAPTPTPGVLTAVSASPNSILQSSGAFYTFSGGTIATSTSHAAIVSVTATAILLEPGVANRTTVRFAASGGGESIETSEQIVDAFGTTSQKATFGRSAVFAMSASASFAVSWETTGAVALDSCAVHIQALAAG